MADGRPPVGATGATGASGAEASTQPKRAGFVLLALLPRHEGELELLARYRAEDARPTKEGNRT